MNKKINTITEIYKGIYCVLLDFPTKEILYSIINKSYKYIWCVNYAADTNVWNNRMTSLYGIEIQDVLTRNLKMEYLMKTEDFLEIIPFLNGSPHLLQINAIPPYYLDLNKLPDHTKYKLLLVNYRAFSSVF